MKSSFAKISEKISQASINRKSLEFVHTFHPHILSANYSITASRILNRPIDQFKSRKVGSIDWLDYILLYIQPVPLELKIVNLIEE